MLSRLTLLFLLLLVGVACPATAQDEGTPAEQAQAAFFSGLDLQSAGDAEGAIARFQLALSHNPELHQARLYLADCFHQIGMDDKALDEVTSYLAVTFPGAETERAQKLFVDYGGDPNTIPGPTVSGETVLDTGANTDGNHAASGGTTVIRPPVVTDPADWSALAVEAGLSGGHHANSVGLTVVGPAVGVRVLPWRFIEVGATFRYGLGGYPDSAGLVTLPGVELDVAASIPVKRARIVLGVVIPTVISKLNDGSRVDAGIGGQAGVRVSVPGTRLVLGGVVEGGYLVQPFLAGSFRVGIQLGDMEGSR